MPLWSILATILPPFWMPRATKMKTQMHPHLQQAKTLNLHTVTHFSLFLWSPRLRKTHHNGDKILWKRMTFARCILEATFFTLLQVLTRKWRLPVSFGEPGGRSTNQVFRLFFRPGGPWGLKWSKSCPQEPLGPNCNWFLTDFWQTWAWFLKIFCCCLVYFSIHHYCICVW